MIILEDQIKYNSSNTALKKLLNLCFSLQNQNSDFIYLFLFQIVVDLKKKKFLLIIFQGIASEKLLFT